MKVTGSDLDRLSNAGGAGARGADARPAGSMEDGFEASLVEMLDATNDDTPRDPQVDSNPEPGEAEVASSGEVAQSQDATGREVVAPQGEQARGESAPETGSRALDEVEAAATHSAPRATAPPSDTAAPRLDTPAPSRTGDAAPANAAAATPRVDAPADSARPSNESQRTEAEAEPRAAEPRPAAAQQANEAASDRPMARTGVERPQAEPRANAERTQLAETPGAETLREAAEERRGDTQTGDDRPRDEARARSVATEDSARSASTRPDAFQMASGAETTPAPGTAQAAAAAVAATGDAPTPPVQAVAPQPPVEAVVAPEEPVAPGSTPRSLPAEAIPQHIEWLAARGGGSAQIQLYPPELGKLAIQVTVRGDDVKVVMNVREAAAQTVVAEYKDSLENALASKELKLDQFEVRDWRERNDAPGNQEQRQHADDAQRDRDGRDRDAAPAGGIAGALSAPLHASANFDRDQAQNVNLRV
ncbi:MAG: flagellar hook-length control protein FliK [Myxococcota bacterium]|nr:flagellar hook-length control protein FliK [Myxococcota bacterium]